MTKTTRSMNIDVIRWLCLSLLVLTACSPPVAMVPAPTPTAVVVSNGNPAVTSAPMPLPTVNQAELGATASTPVVEEPAAPTDASPPTPSRPTLTIYTDDSGSGLQFLQTVAQEYGASSGWSVVVTPKQGDDLRLDFEMASLAEQAPDLLIASNDQIVSFVNGELLQPVDDWFNRADFVEPVVAAANVQGKQWGVPVNGGNQLLLLYNKKLIAAPPATSDDLLKTPKPAGAEATFVTNLNDPRWLIPWLLGFGGRVLGEDRRPTLNTPEVVATYTFLRQLRADGVNPEIDFATGTDMFKAGQVAMIVDGDWSIPWYLEAAASAPDTLDLGIAPLPVVSSTNRPAVPYVGGRYVLAPRGLGGEKREVAKSFVDYLTSAGVQARVVSELRRLPARTENLQSEIVQNDAVLKPEADSLGRAVPFPTVSEFLAIWDALGSRTGAVMVGEVPPTTAAEEVQAEAEAALGQ